MTVDDILRAKGDAVWTIAPEATVFDALSLMAQKNVGALVVKEGGEIAGMVSERDYARKVILHGKSSRELSVREIMSAPVVSVSPGFTVEECMSLMTGKRVRHLPVLDGGRLTGIVSIGDVVKAIISEQEHVIRHLENYITGGR